MPRAPREQPAKPETAPAPEPEPQPDPEPEEQRRRPVQGALPSSQNVVREGQVPQVEHFVPQPIGDDDLAKLNVYQRINAIRGEIGIIPKRGWNDHHHYWFTTDADLNAYIGPLLSKYHLVVIPSVVHAGVERFETAGKQFVTRVPMMVSVINADKPGEKIEIPWEGEGGDTVDKGLYKALTGGLKYFFTKMLQIATGDDPEVFSRTDALADQAAQAAAVQGNSGQGQRPDIRPSSRRQPQKGGRQDEVTEVQLRQVKAMSKALGGLRIAATVIDSALGTQTYEMIESMDSADEAWLAIEATLKTRTGTDVGKVLYQMSQEQAKRAQETAQAAAAPAGYVPVDEESETLDQAVADGG